MAIFNTIYGAAAPEPAFEWWSPKMTSNNTPSPFAASASSIYSISYDAYRCFDNNPETFWHTAEGSDGYGYITFDFGGKKSLDSVRLTSPPQQWIGFFPIKLSVLGSDDARSWVPILTNSPIIGALGASSIYEFAFTSPKTFRFYKFLSGGVTSNKYTAISEIEFHVLQEAGS